MKEIKLGKHKVTLVDDEDFAQVSTLTWHAKLAPGGCFYACRTRSWRDDNNKKRSTTIRLHRHILGVVAPKIDVDHINGDTLDNRKVNLRQCFRSENSRNRTRLSAINTSGYRGVSKRFNTTNKIWIAQIQDNSGARKCLGYFETAEEAARAFDAAARLIYGEFCGKLNFCEPKK